MQQQQDQNKVNTRTENKSRIRMDVSTPPPPSKPACAESRESAKILLKTDATCDTHRKTPNKTMRNAELNMFLHSAARRLAHFFAVKHRKSRCESKTKFNCGRTKCQNSSFSTCQQGIAPPARRQTQRLPTTTTPA